MKNYNDLNYKEKFYRTLWLFPLMILAPVMVWFMGFGAIRAAVAGIVLLAIWWVQLTDNYSKWKNGE